MLAFRGVNFYSSNDWTKQECCNRFIFWESFPIKKSSSCQVNSPILGRRSNFKVAGISKGPLVFVPPQKSSNPIQTYEKYRCFIRRAWCLSENHCGETSAWFIGQTCKNVFLNELSCWSNTCVFNFTIKQLRTKGFPRWVMIDASKSHFTYTKAVIRRWLESRDSTAGDITSQDVATSRDMWRIHMSGYWFFFPSADWEVWAPNLKPVGTNSRYCKHR